jgi:outer membrane protein assembly factor BamE (lipoprotein component of BamABCDE complex)
MLRFLFSALSVFLVCFILPPARSQTSADSQKPAATSATPSNSSNSQSAPPKAPPIPANAPRMLRETRLQIIRDFETQLVYSRTLFPMGSKGLQLKADGTITPNGKDLQELLVIYGPSIKPGDPAHISYVQIKNDHIHFELNGGPIRRQKWYQRIEVAGSNGPVMTGPQNSQTNNVHGSFVDLYFSTHVPEMTAAQLRQLLYPVFDFNARTPEQAYLDTVPPKVKAAILAHHVLVGMNRDMVLYAMGKPPHKDREKDGDVEYEEWIYGAPPADVNFVRFVGDEVVRVETMKVDGEKIVRTQTEVVLPSEQQQEAQKQPDEHPANAPSLRRPGEDSSNVPRPASGAAPPPAMPPPDLPQPNGPNQMASMSMD